MDNDNLSFSGEDNGESLEIHEPNTTINAESEPSQAPLRPASSSRSNLLINRKALIITASTATLVGVVLVGLLGIFLNSNNNPKNKVNSSLGSYIATSNPLSSAKDITQLPVDNAGTLAVNGQLQVNQGLVLAPTATPASPITGEIYYDGSTNTPFFYNGSSFVSLTPTNTTHVTSIGGTSGVVALGDGLTVANNQLSVSSSLLQNVSGAAGATKVTSLQGQSGNVTLTAGNGISIDGTTISTDAIEGLQAGNGIAVSGNQITNSGVVALTSTGNSIKITPAGNGVFDLESSNGGSGGVESISSSNSSLSVTNDGSGNYNVEIGSDGVNAGNYGSSSTAAAFTVNAAGQLTAASSTAIAINGDQITSGTIGDNYLNSNVAIYSNGTSNFTGQLEQSGYNVCSTEGNCVGVPGGSIGGSGSSGVLSMFTGLGYTVGNSDLTQTSGNLTDSGNFTVQGSGGLVLGNGGNTTTIKTNSSGNPVFTLPSTAGGAGQCLTTDGSGNLSFADCLSGSGGGGGTGGVSSLNGLYGAVDLVQGTGLSVTTGSSTVNLGLATTGVTAGSYGSAAQVASFNVNAEGQVTSAASVPIAINGDQITSGTISNAYLDTTVAIYNNLTSNFTGTLEQSGNDVCTTAGNCTGVAGQSLGGSGTTGVLPVFTGSGYTVGNSVLSESDGDLTDTGYLSIEGAGGLILGSGSDTTAIKSSSASAITFTLPSTTGSSGQCLTTDGSGNLAFSNCLSGGSGGAGGVESLNGLSGSVNIAQGTGLTVSTGANNVTVGLGNTGVTNGSYGSGSAVATFTVNNQGQITSAGATSIAINGAQVTSGTVGDTYLASDVALYDKATSNFTGTLQQAGNDVCTAAGNCTGVAGGSVGGSGTSGTLALFNGSGYTIGNSDLTQSSGNLTDSGNLAVQGSGGLTLGSGSNTTTISPGSSTGAINFTLPGNTGSSGQCLITDGSGVLSFTTCSTGGGGGSGVTSLNSLSGSLSIDQGTGISLNNGSSSITIGLGTSGVTSGSYGSASSVATFTVNSQGELTTAGSTPIAIDGNQITSGTVSDSYLATDVALYDKTTSNFTGTLQQDGNDVCTMAANCTGVAGGSIGGSGAAGDLAIFTGSGYTIGNSALTQSSGNLTATGNLTVQGNGGLALYNGTASTSIVSGSNTTPITFTLPSSVGSSDQCLTTDGYGNLSFANCLSGSSGGSGGVSSLNGLSGSLSIAQGTGLSVNPSGSSVTVGLGNTTVTNGSYGSASSVATFTVNNQGQLTTAGSSPIAIAGSQITSGTVNDNYLATDVALYDKTTSNFTGTLQESGNAVCTIAGNCTGVSGGSIGGSGTSGTLSLFTGSGYTIGNSDLSQTGGNLITSGDLDIEGTGGLLLGTGSDTTSLLEGSNTSALSFTLPSTTGSSGQCLTTGGASGVLSFTSCLTGSSGGGGSGVASLNGLTGAVTLQDTSGELSFNPSGQNIGITIASTAVSPNSYGSASSVATFTVNAEGQLTAAGSTPIAINGNQITAGTVATAEGGTGISSYTTGSLLYSSSSSALGQLGDVTSGECLTSGGSGSAPAWGSCGAGTIAGAGTAGQIALFSSSSALTGSVLTQSSGNLASTGSLLVEPSTNSTTALQVQNSSSLNILDVDTTDNVVGVGALPSSTGSTLQVAGSISLSSLGSSGNSVLCMNSNNQLSSCGSSVGNGSYIYNSTSTQSSNFDVQAATSGSVAGTLQANAFGTANVLNIDNGSGVVADSFSSTGNLLIEPSTNSSIALQVDNTSAAPVITADTTDQEVFVGSDAGVATAPQAPSIGTLTTGTSPYYPATGNLCNNSLNDMVTPNYGSNTLSVFCNTGSSGTAAFSSTATESLTAYSEPNNVVTGNFCNNGRTDIAEVSRNSGTAGLYCNTGSTGSAAFSTSVTTALDYSASVYSWGIGSGNLCNNTRNDLVFGDNNGGSGDIYIYCNTGSVGSTSFSAGATKAISLGYSGIFSITTGNFCNNGRTDIAVAIENANDTTIYCNTGSTGSAAFGSSPTETLTGNNTSLDLTSGNFCNNGRTDILVSNEGNGTNSIYCNTGSTGSSAYATSATMTLSTGGSLYVTSGNLCGNGRTDLAIITGATTASTYCNTGSTGTAAFNSTASQTTTTGVGPEGITSANLCNDGKVDLAITNDTANTLTLACTIGGGATYSALQVTSKGSSTPTVVLQSTAGQAADLLDIYNSSGSLLDGINSSGDLCINISPCSADTTAALDVTGNTLLSTSTNSTTAFQVQNSNAINLLGVDTSGNNVYVGSTGSSALASTVDIANSSSSSNAQAVVIGSDGDTSNTVTIDGGTAATGIQIGNTAAAHGIEIGTGAAVQTIAIGSTNSTSSIALKAGTGGLTIQTQGTGTLGIGNNAVAQTLAIGNSTGATSVNIQAGTGGLTIQTQGTGTLGIGNNAIAQTIAIGNSTGATSLSLQSGTGGINLGTGGIADTIQIGNTTGAVAQTIDLGNNATASSTSTVSIGSQVGTSTTTIQGGTGNINLTANGSSNTGVLIKNTNNSSVAFQVQNASGATVLTANTTNQNVTVGTAATSTGNPFASTNTQSLTAGSGAGSVIAGNFCNNGRSDLAVANGTSTTTYIYCNNGSLSTPYSTTYTISLTSGTDPGGLIAGNFCNNNRTDLAVANYGSGTIYVYCNTGSTGSAAFAGTYTMSLTAGANTNDLATGNFCNNGLADLAVTNGNGGTTAYVYCNTGSTGSAAFSSTYTKSLTTAASPNGIISGNFCNNGRADLAVASSSSTVTYIYCNTGSTGAAAFAGTYTISLTGETNPRQIATGNFCNNGRADLAVTNDGSTTAYVYCNTGSTGSSAFAAAYTMSLTAGSSPWDISAGNLCGNGKADIALTNEGGTTADIYCNTGSTGAAAFSATATQTITTGSQPVAITTGNLCNAGRADLAVGNEGSGTAYVYCNQIPVGGAVTGNLQVVGAVTSNVGLLVQGAAGQTANLLGVYTNSNVLLDSINSSGDLCLALSGTCNGTSGLQVDGSTLFENQSNSTTAFQVQNSSASDVFDVDTSDGRIGILTSAPAAKLDIETGSSNDVSVIANTSGTGNLLQLENSGVNVLRVNSSGATLLENSTNSTLAFQVQNASAAPVLTVDTTHQAVFVGNNTSVATLPSAPSNTNLTAGANPLGSTTGNFCNNSRADLAVTNYGTTTAYIYCNTGSSGTAAYASTYTISLTTGSDPIDIKTGNFCNNNRADLAVVNSNTTTAYIYCNTGSTGSAAFSSTYTMSVTTGSIPEYMTSGNFCNNGRTDLAVANYGSATTYIYCNTGSTGSAAFSATNTENLTTGTHPNGITTGNFCNNGRADIAVTNYGATTAYIYCNTGSTGSAAFSATNTESLTTGTTPYGITTGNFCNNGFADLAIANYGSATTYIYCNTGSTGSSAFSSTNTASLTSGTNPSGVTTGNICGNGRADLAVTNYGASTIYLYCNTGSTGSSAFPSTYSSSLATATGSYAIVSGNLCNDSKVDLAATNYSSSSVTLYCTNGGGVNTAMLEVNSKGSTTTDFILQGAASQAADLLDIYNSSGSLLDGINSSGDLCINISPCSADTTAALDVTGNTLLSTSTNSTTAFQVQNSNAINLLGVDTSGNNVYVGSTGSSALASTVDIANSSSSSNAQAVVIGSDGDTSNTVTIDGGTAATGIQIGNTAAAHGIEIGTGAAVQTIAIGSTNSTSSIALKAGTGGLTIQTQGTGTLGIGNNAVAQTLAIGNSTGATSVNIQAGTGGLTIQTQGTGTLGIGNNAIAQTIAIGNSTGATSLSLQSGTGGINLGTGGIADTIQIGNTTGAVAQTIDLGNNATASSTSTVSIGSQVGTSTTTIQGGTGNINLTANGSSNTGVLIKNTNNSSVAFQVQNASGATVLTANTTNQNVTVGTAATSTGNPFASTNTQSLGTGTNPGGDVTGNFCNNGRNDLAVTNNGSGTAYIYCNTGSLSTPFSTYTISLTTGSGPWLITTGNLCNNGRADIAITNNNTTTAYIYCNTGSTGSAAFSSTYTMSLNTGGTNAQFITTGNFCNNGLTDIAIAANGTGPGGYIYCNTGSTGSAAFSSTYTMSLNTSSTPKGLNTGNFCNNGRADIAITNNGSGTAYIYCNTGSTGSAAFSATDTISLNTGTSPYGIAAGNLCNNSRTDIGVANAGGTTLSIYCNTGSIGSSAFSSTATTSLNTGSGPEAISTNNFCGNAKADIAVVNYNSNTASIFCNTGSTGSAAFSSTATQSLTTGTNPWSGVTAGNLCNAGRADLAISNYGSGTAYVFCNQIPAGGAVTGSLQVVGAVTTNAGILVQGASGQTADNLDIYTNSNVLLDKINASGDLCVALSGVCNGTSGLQVDGSGLFENQTNSTTAFQIQNSAGTSNLFDADTTDSRIGIGTNAPGNLLSIGALTTAENGYQIAVSTGGTTSSGIVVQTVASQSSGYVFQAQNSSGSTLAYIDYQGNLSVQSATINGTLTINGHVVTANSSGSTTATVQTSAGTSATCTISGDDTDGHITLVTGSGSWASGAQCNVTFANSFSSAPNTVISPTGTTNPATVLPTITTTNTGFTINFLNADTGSNTYTWNYVNLD